MGSVAVLHAIILLFIIYFKVSECFRCTSTLMVTLARGGLVPSVHLRTLAKSASIQYQKLGFYGKVSSTSLAVSPL